MVTEIQFILENQNSFVQGNAFERIIRDVLETHRYSISSDINYTGMEIDLVAEHKDRKDELLYVECKAKEKVKSFEILSFEAKVRFKKASFGYFIRTKELDHQAAGLVDEMKQDPRYSHISFFEPEKVVEILQDASKLKRVDVDYNGVTKLIFACSFFGDFYIYIRKNSLGAIPAHFTVYDGCTGKIARDEETVSKLQTYISEISSLTLLVPNIEITDTPKAKLEALDEIETISEVQESENWFDYLPASSRHFIGRDNLRNQVFDFFRDVVQKKTRRRLFYLTGKSGWGKSSFVAEIRGRCRNKHYKKKFYSIAIDTRSATSSNFVAIAFERLILYAKRDGFLENSIFAEELKFTSNTELLTSSSIQAIISYLESENKALILIFDQFEDVFRKSSLFHSFYKFLSDVTDLTTNIIIGFSWKTEILIPSENEAYYHWQQAKEQAIQFSIPEFGSKEINGIINQLEISTQKIGKDLKRRVIESSQSLPWLTKKLCIHIYNQIRSNVKPEKLIDDNLNIKSLFFADLESLTSDELATLKYIAKKASDGIFLDITEIGENVPEASINSLRDKRLIIRSGANYIIYWDIFRDFLLTGDVPAINESYILRQTVNACLNVFLVFPADGSPISFEDLRRNLKKEIKKASIDNVLLELRNIGIIYKIAYQDSYKVVDGVSVTKEGFIDFLQVKFVNNTIFNKILKWEKKTVSPADVAEILKETFKAYDFQDKTWDTYARSYITWLKFAKLQFDTQLVEPRKGRQRLSIPDGNTTIILRNSPSQLIDSLTNINTANKSTIRDMYIIGLIDKNELLTDLGWELVGSKEYSKLYEMVHGLYYIKEINELISLNPKLKAKDIVKRLPTIFSAPKESSNIIYATIALSWIKKGLGFRKNDLGCLMRIPPSRIIKVIRSGKPQRREVKYVIKFLNLESNKLIDKSTLKAALSGNSTFVDFKESVKSVDSPESLIRIRPDLFNAPTENSNKIYAKNLYGWLEIHNF